MKLEEYKEKYKDDRFYYEVFVHKIYDPALEVKHDIIMDLGACAGEFSFYMSDKAKKIYAIEPFHDHYKELVKNIKEFEFNNVIPFNVALGDENRMGHMAEGYARGGAVLSDDKTPTPKDIPVKTLATFMKENNIDNIDVLKVDIEECEKQVFEAPDFEEVAHKIKFIIGEHVGAVSSGILENFGFIKKECPYGMYFKR